MISFRRVNESRLLFLLLLAAGLEACDPYACTTKARSATYVGRLGESVAPTTDLTLFDSGSVILLLNEWRGSVSQQSVEAGVNVQGFVPAVSEIHVRAGTPANPGRVLWRTDHGYLVRDTIWNSYRDLFAGPGTWADMWNLLDAGEAYFEVHSPAGDSAAAGLRQETATGFTPSCT